MNERALISINTKTDSSKQKNIKDLTTGSPFMLIIMFTLPLILGNFFQQLYNLSDTAIIGYALGDNALASIGATTSIYGLMIGFIVGVNNGFSLIIAKYFGAKDIDYTRKAIAHSFMISLSLSIIITICSIFFLKPVLFLLHTPADIIESSYTYIRIIFLFVIVTSFYNVEAAVLRALGNSKTPLYFLMISTVLNIILALFFVITLKLGVAGAAYATVIAQFFSGFLCYLYIKKYIPIIHLSKEHFQFDSKVFKELCTAGFSMGMMLCIVSIGTIALQSAINSMGTQIIVAHTTARRLEELFMQPIGSSLSVASATFASQNLGAGKSSRIRRGTKNAIVISFIWSTVAIAICLLYSKQMVTLLIGTTNETVIQYASLYLKTNLPFLYILSILVILRSTLQGMGSKLVPLLASFIELFGKFIFVQFFASSFGYIGVCFTEPIIWILCAIVVVITYLIANKKLPVDTIITT